MLTLYRSNRAEVLVQLLAAQLRHPAPGPLEPVQVVVNTWPTSRWLGEALALHLGGIAANLRYPFPGSHLRKVVQLLLAEPMGSEAEANADPWRAIHLVWSVLEELPRLAAAPEGEQLRHWLSSRPWQGKVVLPTWQLARAIADALDDYGLYRPELLQQWEVGQDIGTTGQPLPRELLWQPSLYRRLRQRLDAEPFGLRVMEVIRRLKEGEKVSDQLRQHLGERLRVFGPSSMAPIQVELLQALALRLPVDLYLLTPCPGLWQRCMERRKALSEALALHQPLEEEWLRKAPPLEARFGRLGAEFQQLLEGTGETQLSEEREEDLFLRPTRLMEGIRPPRLLHQLQEHLLSEDLQPGFHLADGDSSLEFHACPGALRQVQIVRDRVLQLLADDPTLEPRHILVMTPTVETFAPLVATVFGDQEATGVPLPWRLTDRSQQQEGGVSRTLLELLTLAGDRLTASGLERLLECGPLQHRFGLSAEEAAGVSETLQRCGFRWGVDAGDRQGDPTHSLSWAIDRLLLGLVLPMANGAWDTSTAPAPPPAPLELGGRVLHLLLRLRHWLQVLRVPRLCSDWLEELTAMLEDLFGDASEAPELAGLHSALADWRRSAVASALLLEPTVVAAVLQERLSLDSGRFGHRSGALTISALEPMRAIPHRVLILMGLDAGAFPRQGQRPGFHLMEGERRLGDPNSADQDRYALMEALLSARDTLLISWNCRDERTGVGRPPSAPVQQWLQWLESTLPPGAAEALQVSHEPNPLEPANFLPQGGRPPASCDQRLLEACRHLQAGIERPTQGLIRPRADGDPEPSAAQGDPYEDLRAWLMEPQVRWLRSLGMVPGERQEEVDDLEPLELSEKERAVLLREAWIQETGQIAPLDSAEGWLLRHRGEGRFPPGEGAIWEASRLHERWLSLQAALEPLGEERRKTLRWGAWSGETCLRGDAVVVVQTARAIAMHRLDLWLQLQLAVAALEPAPPKRGLLIARQSPGNSFQAQLVFRAPDGAAARSELTRLWALRQDWRTACWPVPPETGWSWLEHHGPEPGSKEFEAVNTIWDGNSYSGGGERWRVEMQLCFGTERSLESLLEELPFREQATSLLGPILGSVVPSKDARR